MGIVWRVAKRINNQNSNHRDTEPSTLQITVELFTIKENYEDDK